jgi:AcrR family transcriptional regulator
MTPQARRRRSYRSELRDRLKADAREKIVKTAVEVIVRRGIDAFTMQTVADNAGMALRTVYRYFATREQLLEGLSEHVDTSLAAIGLRAPATVADIKAVMPSMYHYFARVQNEMRASVVASIATGYRATSHRARHGAVRAMLSDAFPALSAREIDDASAMLFAVSGSRVWYVVTAELGLAADRAGAAAEWAVQLLLDDLQKRNDAARRRARSTRRRAGDA